MDTKDIKTVKMFGPSLSDPTKIVNRDIPEADVQAYKASGYQLGSVAEEADPAEAPEKEFATAGKTYTEKEAAAHIAPKAKGKGK